MSGSLDLTDTCTALCPLRWWNRLSLYWRNLISHSLNPQDGSSEAASEAFDARPRRDRDACSNAFDALESIAKVRFGMPAATFGQVLAHIRQNGRLNGQIIGVLEAVKHIAKTANFGHGMVDLVWGLRPPKLISRF